MTRTVFTTITPLPAGVSREVVLETLHDHLAMIDLNPSHDTRERMEKPPPEATPEEYHCTWYSITDRVSYFPGYKGSITFTACFHNLTNGLQTHCYAPLGLDLKEKWTLGGNLPHEPVQPAEIGVGAPISGLYLREDVDMKCNYFMTRFVRKTLKDALAALVARLLVKSQIEEAAIINKRLTHGQMSPTLTYSTAGTPPGSPPHSASLVGSSAGQGMTLPPFQPMHPMGVGVDHTMRNSYQGAPDVKSHYGSIHQHPNPQYPNPQHVPYHPNQYQTGQYQGHVPGMPTAQGHYNQPIEMADTYTGPPIPPKQPTTAELPS